MRLGVSFFRILYLVIRISPNSLLVTRKHDGLRHASLITVAATWA
jgi:hypothetical protein